MVEKLAPVQVATAFQSVGKSLGSYHVLDGIALGSITEIYLARITAGQDAGKHALIHQLQPRLAEDPQFVTLFLDEARRAADLTHVNIGRVREYGSRSGVYFLATDYLHGHSARALLDKVRTQPDGRMPLEHALTLVGAVAAGLQSIHEKRDPSDATLRLIHSAVWPSNIVITYDGGVKLVDMALARIASSEHAMRKQLSKGKVAYFAPEQCHGQTLTELDRHCDIFSLGVLLYEVTTGTRLFRRDDGDSDFVVRARIIKGEIPPPTTVVQDYPHSLEDVVMQALALKPGARHPTAQSLMLDVQAVARTSGLTLSQNALSGYLNKLFGPKQEPWKDIDDDDEDDQVSIDAAAQAPAGNYEPVDDDDLPPGADEFEDEVATTLYTGNPEDIKDAWVAEALAPGVRASTQSPLPRVSERRIALPLQAGDSGAFKSSQATPRHSSHNGLTHASDPQVAADRPLTNSDVAGPIEATALDGLPRAPTASPLPDSLPARRERALSRPGVYDGTEPLPVMTSTGQSKQPRRAPSRAPSGPYLDIQPQSPTGPALPPRSNFWQRAVIVLGVVAVTLTLAYLLLG